MANERQKTFDSYKLKIDGVIVDVTISSEADEPVPVYVISILNISETTQRILGKLRQEFISRINTGAVIDDKTYEIKELFKQEIRILIHKYFPGIDSATSELLVGHVIQQNVGLGNIDILLQDEFLEEIVINNKDDPVWVYHKKHGWLKTNVLMLNEAQIRHYATTIGRDVGKEITLLKPLMDAHLKSGDRVNATLNPISSQGNTITIRKFAKKPWTITDLIKLNTIDYETTAWIWLAIQNELSVLIAGGTGSGKTSFLNAMGNFFPPNQRIISIEDTRELTLPKTLHWVPMETRLPNPEGKGEITMLDLVINSLRMRPDRIIMGEVRRKSEAEVLFEAMHTGHSVYATLHANDVNETIIRLTNPPIDMPKIILGALGLIVIQSRNRRSGQRRTLQLAEISRTGDANVLTQLDMLSDKMVRQGDPKQILNTLNLFTGLSPAEIEKDIASKIVFLKKLVSKNIDDVHEIGIIMSKYYLGKLHL